MRGPGCRSEHRSCGETRHGCVRDLLPGEFSSGENGSWSLGSFSANEVSNTGRRSRAPGRIYPGKTVMLASCVPVLTASSTGEAVTAHWSFSRGGRSVNSRLIVVTQMFRRTAGYVSVTAALSGGRFGAFNNASRASFVERSRRQTAFRNRSI